MYSSPHTNGLAFYAISLPQDPDNTDQNNACLVKCHLTTTNLETTNPETSGTPLDISPQAESHAPVHLETGQPQKNPKIFGYGSETTATDMSQTHCAKTTTLAHAPQHHAPARWTLLKSGVTLLGLCHFAVDQQCCDTCEIAAKSSMNVMTPTCVPSGTSYKGFPVYLCTHTQFPPPAHAPTQAKRHAKTTPWERQSRGKKHSPLPKRIHKTSLGERTSSVQKNQRAFPG